MNESKRIWNGEDLSHAAYRAVLDAGDSDKTREFEAKLTAWSMENLEHWTPDPEKYPALTSDDLSDLRKFIGDATSEAFDQRIGRNVENVAFLEEAIYDKANEIAARKDAEIAALKSEIESLKPRLRHIAALVNAPLDTEDERHVHMRIRKAKPAPMVIFDTEDDE